MDLPDAQPAPADWDPKAHRFDVRRRLREARAYAHTLGASASDPGARVLIYAQGRSGTTLLETLLCSTGLFKINGEPLGRGARNVFRPVAYLRGISRESARQGPDGNFICHVKPLHLDEFRRWSGHQPIDTAAMLGTLVRDGWHIVHVRRENRLRHMLSGIMADARCGYHKEDDRPETTRIHVRRDDLETRLAFARRWAAEEEAALATVPKEARCEVVYERDLLDSAHHEATVDRVLGSIGLVRDQPIQTSLRKINNRPVSDLVENYDEFAEWAHEFGLGEWLDASATGAGRADSDLAPRGADLA